MILSEQLDKIRSGAASKIPADTLATMHQETEALRNSGIMDGVIKVGDKLPDFELANQNGEVIRSRDLLANGPLVLSIFRGHW